ncbi:MAG: enoyl-CoA hydratase/isomerase family protein [Pseudomonadota bacterium]
MSETSEPEAFGEFISVTRRGRVVEVRFDRGDGLNALSLAAMSELKGVAHQLADDVESSVIILTGARAFSAGADLKDPALIQQASKTLLEQRAAVRLGPDMCQAWADLEQVTIAAVEGHCIGGGLALAVACDHRVAADGAQFRLPEVPLGMNMSWRSVPRIVALIGPSRAKELIILGRKLEARDAEQWGLLDRLVGRGGAMDAARALAEEYAALPPLALRMAKQAINASAEPLGYATSYMDRDQFLLTRKSSDQHEAISAFLEKRAPTYTGD